MIGDGSRDSKNGLSFSSTRLDVHFLFSWKVVKVNSTHSVGWHLNGHGNSMRPLFPTDFQKRRKKSTRRSKEKENGERKKLYIVPIRELYSRKINWSILLRADNICFRLKNETERGLSQGGNERYFRISNAEFYSIRWK